MATASIIAPKLNIYFNLFFELVSSFTLSETQDHNLNKYSTVKTNTEKYSKREK